MQFEEHEYKGLLGKVINYLDNGMDMSEYDYRFGHKTSNIKKELQKKIHK